MGKALTTTAGAALGLGLAVLGAMNASAATQFTVGDITVHYLGEVDTSFPLVSQPLATSTSSPFVGQIMTGSPGTLPGNPGWDPYGSTDTTHEWWGIYQGYANFAQSAVSSLAFIWGSPNYNDPANTNYLTFSYAGGSATVKASDLYSNFNNVAPPIDNGNHPGYLLSFTSSSPINNVQAGLLGNSADFEFAFTTGVPEPATWGMMLVGFAGVAFLGLRRKRQPIALSL